MAQVAFAQEPFQVAVGGVADGFRVEGGFFAGVAAGVGFVALGAVVEIELAAGFDVLGVGGQGIGAGVVAGGDVVEVRVGGGEGE